MPNVFSAVVTCTRDAEVKYIQSGQALLTVNVANNQGFGDKQTTLFIRVNLWGKRAEGQLKDFLLKGTKIFISGELTQSSYTGNDGTAKTSLELNANVIELVGKKSDNAGQSQPAPQSQHHEQKSNGYSPTTQVTDAPYDDDIPFNHVPR